MMHFMDEAHPPAGFRCATPSQRDTGVLLSFLRPPQRCNGGGPLRRCSCCPCGVWRKRHGGIPGISSRRRYEAAQEHARRAGPTSGASFFRRGARSALREACCRPSSAARPASGCACICGGWCAATDRGVDFVCGGVSRCRPSTCRWTSMSARRRVRWDCLAAADRLAGPSRS